MLVETPLDETQLDETQDRRGDLVSRALKNQGLWLSVAYVGLILLMARTYA